MLIDIEENEQMFKKSLQWENRCAIIRLTAGLLIYGNEYNIVRKNFNLELILNS